MNRALVLSSGGVDSTTCVGIAVDRFGKENVATVSFNYGQRHDKELKCAAEIAKYYEVPHYVIDLTSAGIFNHSNCSLLKHSEQSIEHASYEEQISKKENGMVSTYVPFRNGLLLSSAASLAVSLWEDDTVYIFIGAHADDAAGNAYADCSAEFNQAMFDAIRIGTYEKVLLTAPLVGKNKAEVVKKGLSLNVPYHLTWSCYEGGDVQCGTCGTCIDRKKAFELNGVEDPVPYKE